MKVTVEISENELREVRKYTGEKKKGPAIRKMVVNALLLRRRADLTENILNGETSVEFPNWESLRKADRRNPWQP